MNEDHKDLPLICKKGIYIMQYFVNNGFKDIKLKLHNFSSNFIQVVSLDDIMIVDSNCIFKQSFLKLLQATAYVRISSGQKSLTYYPLFHQPLEKCYDQVLH